MKKSAEYFHVADNYTVESITLKKCYITLEESIETILESNHLHVKPQVSLEVNTLKSKTTSNLVEVSLESSVVLVDTIKELILGIVHAEYAALVRCEVEDPSADVYLHLIIPEAFLFNKVRVLIHDLCSQAGLKPVLIRDVVFQKFKKHLAVQMSRKSNVYYYGNNMSDALPIEEQEEFRYFDENYDAFVVDDSDQDD